MGSFEGTKDDGMNGEKQEEIGERPGHSLYFAVFNVHFLPKFLRGKIRMHIIHGYSNNSLSI